MTWLSEKLLARIRRYIGYYRFLLLPHFPQTVAVRCGIVDGTSCTLGDGSEQGGFVGSTLWERLSTRNGQMFVPHRGFGWGAMSVQCSTLTLNQPLEYTLPSTDSSTKTRDALSTGTHQRVHRPYPITRQADVTKLFTCCEIVDGSQPKKPSSKQSRSETRPFSHG